jgi:hypothetical protein
LPEVTLVTLMGSGMHVAYLWNSDAIETLLQDVALTLINSTSCIKIVAKSHVL